MIANREYLGRPPWGSDFLLRPEGWLELNKTMLGKIFQAERTLIFLLVNSSTKDLFVIERNLGYSYNYIDFHSDRPSGTRKKWVKLYSVHNKMYINNSLFCRQCASSINVMLERTTGIKRLILEFCGLFHIYFVVL